MRGIKAKRLRKRIANTMYYDLDGKKMSHEQYKGVYSLPDFKAIYRAAKRNGLA